MKNGWELDTLIVFCALMLSMEEVTGLTFMCELIHEADMLIC